VKWWLLDSCSLLLVHQLNGAILSLTSPPFLHPTSEDGSCSLVILLLLFEALEALEALLQLNYLLGLPVEALLSERLFILFVGDLDLGPSSLRADLEEVGAGALGV
jgi:hypothetical protein